MIEKFITKFTTEKVNYEIIENGFYLVDKTIKSLDLPYPLVFKGLFLGQVIKNKFQPSLALLDVLANLSKEKVYVNNIGEIDFLYGKNLRKRHITMVKGSTKIGFLKLIMKHNQCLGYGKLVRNLNQDGIVIKNILDKGDYLRRESH